MQKRLFTVFICVVALSLSTLAQHKMAAGKKAGPGGPDKAYLQKLLDGWNTLDPANVAPYYAQGANTFFDIAPLKYNNWDEYAAGAKKLLADYKSLNLSMNDDAVVHQHGDLAWATATLKEDATLKSGKRELATMRWTLICEKQNGKWLIVHEHVSEPLQ